MKKYTTLTNVDYTNLVNEVINYLNQNFDVEDDSHRTEALTWLGDPTSIQDIPSIHTTFTGESLSIAGLAHYAINCDALLINEYDVNILFVPLMDYSDCTIKLFDVAQGAIINNYAYSDDDCTLAETIPLTSPVFLRKNTAFTIETTDLYKLSDILVVIFKENTDSYFE